MRIEISNRQKKHRVNLTKIRRLTRWLMGQVQQLDPRRSWQEISLVLTDDGGIMRLNEEYFSKPYPTDVISFHYEPMPGEGENATGELIVNVERAHAEGAQRDGSSRELALYIAHGCLHLTGAEDHTASLRAKMRRQETHWLKQAEGLDYIPGIMDERSTAAS